MEQLPKELGGERIAFFETTCPRCFNKLPWTECKVRGVGWFCKCGLKVPWSLFAASKYTDIREFMYDLIRGKVK